MALTFVQTVVPLPSAPEFHPTEAEWADPFRYIESIRHIGEKSGIVRIVTPESWQVPPAFDASARFRTRVQRVHLLRYVHKARNVGYLNNPLQSSVGAAQLHVCIA